ncbi:MAG: TonB-dependent receptor [Bacteroidota bacterium]
MKKYILIFLLFGALIFQLQGQNSLSGTVSDGQGRALPGVRIELLNSGFGAISDENGAFSFSNIPSGKQILKASLTGFSIQTQDVSVPTESTVNFQLQEILRELEPIVVTATKREVDAQTLSTAITTIDAQSITDLQIDNINELGRSIPNFNVSDDGGGVFPLVSVRGIATISDVPIVGIYVDDVPLFNTASFPFILNNIERIEVLRGPQGTLYGRNSLGGVINIISKQPTNRTSGFATVGYGNLNQLQLSAGVNTPLIKDKLFLGVDGSYSQRDGYVTNTFSGNSDLLGNELGSGNLKLTYLFNDRWSLNLRTGFESRDINAYALVGGPGVTGAALDSLRENHPYELSYNTEGRYKTLSSNNALRINYYGSNLFFKSITTFQSTDLEVRGEEFDFTQFDLNDTNSDRLITTFSEEIRFGSNSNDSRINWLGGAFFYRYEYDNDGKIGSGADNVLFAPSPEVAAIYPYVQEQRSILTQTGISIFGNVDIELVDQLKLSLGLRYEWEDSQSENQTDYVRSSGESFEFPPLGLIPNRFEAATDFSAFSPKLGLTYQLTEQQILYASVARGYRPGGINPFTTAEENVTYDPEFTWNFELGWKADLLSNRMRLNLTGFYIDYTDQQLLTVVDFVTFSIGNQNIGKSISYGLELEWDYLLAKGLQASVGLGFLETEIEEYAVVGFAGEIDNSGNESAYAPRWNGNMGLTYSTKLGAVQFGASANYQFQTEIFLDPENVYTQPGYGLLDARISAEYKGIELAIWSQNLMDEVFFSYGYSLTGFGGFGSYGLPRTFGTSLTVKF